MKTIPFQDLDPSEESEYDGIASTSRTVESLLEVGLVAEVDQAEVDQMEASCRNTLLEVGLVVVAVKVDQVVALVVIADPSLSLWKALCS